MIDPDKLFKFMKECGGKACSITIISEDGQKIEYRDINLSYAEQIGLAYMRYNQIKEMMPKHRHGPVDPNVN